MKEYTLEELATTIATIETSANIELLEGNNEMYDRIYRGVRIIRESIIEKNKSIIFHYFHLEDPNSQETTMDAFFSDHVWVSNVGTKVVKKFDGMYYLVDVKYRWIESGILDTRMPNERPETCPPVQISSQYPEIVMLKYIEYVTKCGGKCCNER